MLFLVGGSNFLDLTAPCSFITSQLRYWFYSSMPTISSSLAKTQPMPHSTLIHTRPLDSHQHARIQTCCHTWSVGTNLVSTWWSLRCHIIWEHDQCPPIFTFTKPDISFAANKAWQFMGNPTTIHWLAVKQTLRYVKDTSSYDINMQQFDSLDIHGYILMPIGHLI